MIITSLSSITYSKHHLKKFTPPNIFITTPIFNRKTTKQIVITNIFSLNETLAKKIGKH